MFPVLILWNHKLPKYAKIDWKFCLVDLEPHRDLHGIRKKSNTSTKFDDSLLSNPSRLVSEIKDEEDLVDSMAMSPGCPADHCHTASGDNPAFDSAGEETVSTSSSYVSPSPDNFSPHHNVNSTNTNDNHSCVPRTRRISASVLENGKLTNLAIKNKLRQRIIMIDCPKCKSG